MKNIVLLFFSCLIFNQLFAQESKIQFGISLTPQVSDHILDKDRKEGQRVSENGGDRQFGYDFGLKGRYFFKEKTSISFGLHYILSRYDLGIRSGIIFRDDPNNPDSSLLEFIPGPRYDNITFHLLAIPINFEYWFNKNWNVISGLSFQRIVNKKRTVQQGNGDIMEVSTGIINEIPIGLNFGASGLFHWENTALQVSPVLNLNFNKIHVLFSVESKETKLQYAAGFNITFWFK